jgi:hypothetical protein
MSASPVFTSAAMGRPFIFPLPSSPGRSENANAAETKRKTAEILSRVGAISKLPAVVPASRLDVCPLPEMVSSGIPQLNSLTGGLPRGCLTEICGTASSGRTSVLLSALARATQRGEVCALVDASDAFDPASAVAAGMEMSRLLWVRCGILQSAEKRTERGAEKLSSVSVHRFSDARNYLKSDAPFRAELPRGAFAANSLAVEGGQLQQRGKVSERTSRWKNSKARCWEPQLAQMLKVTDLLLQSNGFGMIALDLGDIPMQSARRIPLASWFRFRRAVEHTPTALLVLEQQPIAGSCSSVLVKVSGRRSPVGGKKLSASRVQLAENRQHCELPHSELLDQFEITAELLRSRLEEKLERKPVQSTASFKSRAAWLGSQCVSAKTRY